MEIQDFHELNIFTCFSVICFFCLFKIKVFIVVFLTKSHCLMIQGWWRAEKITTFEVTGLWIKKNFTLTQDPNVFNEILVSGLDAVYKVLKRGWQRRQWHPTPVLLPGKSHGWRSPVGCSPWGYKESDTTEHLHFHFSLSCMGEANGNPLQCSCLENPRDGGAWWAAVYGVTQSRTRLKRLSSSSKSESDCILHVRWLWIIVAKRKDYGTLNYWSHSSHTCKHCTASGWRGWWGVFPAPLPLSLVTWFVWAN